jgi:hypothetical protein
LPVTAKEKSEGRLITIYYRAPTGLLDFGHILIYVRNDETGEGAYFDYYPGDNSATVIGNVDQKRIDAHASFTIVTSAAQEQAILDGIKDFQKSPSDYSAFGAQCTTMCSTILEKGNLGLGKAVFPTDFWNTVFRKYDPDAMIKSNLFRERSGAMVKDVRAPYEPGKEFGRDPRGQARIQDANAINANVKTTYQGGKVIKVDDYRPRH